MRYYYYKYFIGFLRLTPNKLPSALRGQPSDRAPAELRTIPTMSVNKVFVKKSRRGNVVLAAREHYLRDDLACGAFGCTLCPVRLD